MWTFSCKMGEEHKPKEAVFGQQNSSKEEVRKECKRRRSKARGELTYI